MMQYDPLLTILIIITGILFASFILFAFKVVRHPDLHTSRRWKVSVLTGLALFVSSYSAFSGIVLVMFILRLNYQDLSIRYFAHAVYEFLQGLILTLVLTTCIMTPFMYIATLATFQQTSDYWVGRLWKDTRVVKRVN